MSTGNLGGAPSTIPLEAFGGVDALKKTLTEIGTRERSMKPAVLANYPLLLGCKEVKRRLKTVKQGNPGDVAYEAIKGAIAYQRDDLDSLVATTIMADHADFEEKYVYQRVEMLKDRKPISCSEDKFKERRPHVITLMAKYLADGRGEEQEEDARTNAKPLIPVHHETAISALTCVVLDAERLADLCAIYLMTQAIDAALKEGDDSPRPRIRLIGGLVFPEWRLENEPHFRRHPSALRRPMWKACRDLIVSSMYCFGTTDPTNREKVRNYLPQGVFVEVEEAVANLNSEVYPNDADREQVYQLCTDGLGAQSIQQYRSLHELTVYRWSLYFFWQDPSEMFSGRIWNALIRCRKVSNLLHNYIGPVSRTLIDALLAENVYHYAPDAIDAVCNYYGVELDFDGFSGSSLFTHLEHAATALILHYVSPPPEDALLT